MLWLVKVLSLGAGILVGALYTQPKLSHHPDSLEEHISRVDDNYMQTVQPIFNNKCVACHSCYNSPCQLDLTSFEGLSRGATKKNVYDFPEIFEDKPSRLEIDERTTLQWRERGFWSVTHRRNEKSILDLVLAEPDKGIFRGHEFLPDAPRACTSLEDDLRFFRKNPRGHMPYGFPNLSLEEHRVITTWLDKGAKYPSKEIQKQLRTSFHKDGPQTLEKWENYLNDQSFKSRLRSRYIYEHLFYAALTFENLPGEHYRLVRAENEKGDPVEIATTRPFDPTGKAFFYRFRKNIRTLMDKTNLPYHLSEKKLDRWKQLFDKTELLPGPDKFPEYGPEGSNAFYTFKRLNPRSRYQFLLDDAYYHIMTFIKGPVCRGATALNVINDHFWVVFRDPSDKTLDDRELQQVFEAKMFPPASTKDKLESFDRFKEGFWKALEKKYASYEKHDISMGLDSVWDGGEEHNPSALLTVYRHNDSAQVLKGAHGDIPKTVWMIDYQIFEDIYYNLVAGYNVYGPLIHQVNTRLYMEISRISSEDLFLTLIDPQERMNARNSWTTEEPEKKKSLSQKVVELFTGSTKYKMTFKYPFMAAKIKKTNGKASTVRDVAVELREAHFKHKNFMSRDGLNRDDESLDISTSARRFTSRRGAFVSFLPDVAMVLINGKLYTLARNKFHYNVSMMFFENNRENPEFDELNLIRGVAASYPNIYFMPENFDEFSKELVKVSTKNDYQEFLRKYAISRHDPLFWEKNDAFNRAAREFAGDETGRFDLSRYDQF